MNVNDFFEKIHDVYRAAHYQIEYKGELAARFINSKKILHAYTYLPLQSGMLNQIAEGKYHIFCYHQNMDAENKLENVLWVKFEYGAEDYALSLSKTKDKIVVNLFVYDHQARVSRVSALESHIFKNEQGKVLLGSMIDRAVCAENKFRLLYLFDKNCVDLNYVVMQIFNNEDC
jgi:hypothetical protein